MAAMRYFRWILCFLLAGALQPAHAETSVRCSLDRTTIGMGDSVTLETRVSTGYTATRSGHRVIPFVNGKRWGAIETSDANGNTTHLLPLPNTGIAEIQVLVEPPATRAPKEAWIWGDTLPETSTQYFQRSFDFDGDPTGVTLRVAVDDVATVYLNGNEIGRVEGWRDNRPLPNIAEHLLPGENVLSIAASTVGGLAGLLVRVDAHNNLDTPLLVSDEGWKYFPAAPYGWPFRAEEDGQIPVRLSELDWSPYRASMTDWPTLTDRQWERAGRPLPSSGILSTPLQVRVTPRPLVRPVSNPMQRVGIQFEPWFTPRNANWSSAQAIPLTGRYWSWNTDVIRQQLIWLTESGIDFLVVDWTNHLWGKEHWNERPDASNEIIHATTMLLETLATMRDEDHPVPGVVLYLGLNNGPATTVTAIDEALDWIHNTYVRNPRFNGLFESYLEKPLVLVHNGGGPNWQDVTGVSMAANPHFTVRQQSFHHEFNQNAEHGFWSWMDGTLTPVPTMREGRVEALTVSTAFFAQGGWRQAGAYGRRGGATLAESFRSALLHRPQFLQIHQFQEFAGQWEGFGYGPNRDLYVDSYSVELSDDIEPVSRTAAAYRGHGGWGFYYLNLLRALVDLYQQEELETTVLVLSQPHDRAVIQETGITLAWQWLGNVPSGFELRVNGQRIAIDEEVPHYELDLSPFPDGPLNITLTAVGTQSRYPLFYDRASAALDILVPAKVELQCVLEKP